MGGVETNISWIQVCLASEREGEPTSQRPGSFHVDEYLLRNCDTALLLYLADRQRERKLKPFWRSSRKTAPAPWSTTTRARWALCGDKIRYVAYAFHNVCFSVRREHPT